MKFTQCDPPQMFVNVYKCAVISWLQFVEGNVVHQKQKQIPNVI